MGRAGARAAVLYQLALLGDDFEALELIEEFVRALGSRRPKEKTPRRRKCPLTA